jgi:hypothetical protein
MKLNLENKYMNNNMKARIQIIKKKHPLLYMNTRKMNKMRTFHSSQSCKPYNMVEKDSKE